VYISALLGVTHSRSERRYRFPENEGSPFFGTSPADLQTSSPTVSNRGSSVRPSLLVCDATSQTFFCVWSDNKHPSAFRLGGWGDVRLACLSHLRLLQVIHSGSGGGDSQVGSYDHLRARGVSRDLGYCLVVDARQVQEMLLEEVCVSE
jgi:hypothetical protein